jgi:uncharacterized lipoprotein YbaY
MRTVAGAVLLPANAPATRAGHIHVEVRDISLADAPSVLVAKQQLDNVPLTPNGRIGFHLPVPEVAPNRTLSLRVHIDVDGNGSVNSGDLLTTASYPIPPIGTPSPLEVAVSVV